MSKHERSDKNGDKLKSHPCFFKEAHKHFGRIPPAVAPACNIQCRYYIKKYDFAHESRSGVTNVVQSPEEACYRIRALVEKNER